MRLRLVPQETSFDFFKRAKLWLGISALMMVVGFASFLFQGLNFGIDFRGGTTIRTEATETVDVWRLPRCAGGASGWAMCRSPRCSIRPSRRTSTSP